MEMWNKKLSRSIELSLQISLVLPMDFSCWVWFLPFPLNTTHKPCFCQAASACSFTCCLPAHRNGAGSTPCWASRMFQQSPIWNLRWVKGKTEMVFAASAATVWPLRHFTSVCKQCLTLTPIQLYRCHYFWPTGKCFALGSSKGGRGPPTVGEARSKSNKQV